MILATCQHERKQKYGKDRKGNQRFKCCLCGQTFAAEAVKPLGDSRTDMKDATTIIGLLMEGMSVRACERLTGVCRQTICDLILVVGQNCQRFLDKTMVSVEAKDVQLDEIWSFVGMKERTRVATARSSEWGDSWTFIAIDRDTKLVLTHAIGQRDMATSTRFLNQLDRATTGRFQLSSDGLGSYTLNVPFVFGSRVDFAQLIKTFAGNQSTVRYSPVKISGAEKVPRFGNPDMDRVCTSHVERLNLTLRMNMRRFTRLTNGHSKSARHHAAVQSMFFCWYNFVRPHQTLKGASPAMAAGLAEKRWTVRQMIETVAQD